MNPYERARMIVLNAYPNAECVLQMGKFLAVYRLYDGDVPLADFSSSRRRAWIKTANAIQHAPKPLQIA